jgi:hypothetical protein
MTDTTALDQTTGNTREAWLHRAIDAFRPRFVEIGLPLPDDIHVSFGFGYGARAESKYILGQTWRKDMSKDNINHLFIGPMEGDPAEILITLLHELIHVADDLESGHRGAFAEAATRLGFLGPMTQTPPSVTLAAEMAAMAETLGAFPHAALDVDAIKVATEAPKPSPVPGVPTWKGWSGPPKQSARMVKVACPEPECGGYMVRMSRKWIAVGTPTCPAGHQMVADLTA